MSDNTSIAQPKDVKRYRYNKLQGFCDTFNVLQKNVDGRMGRQQARDMANDSSTSLPDLFDAAKPKPGKAKRGRPRKENPKAHVSLRVDADVLEALKSTGPGWQTFINDVLRKALSNRHGGVVRQA